MRFRVGDALPKAKQKNDAKKEKPLSSTSLVKTAPLPVPSSSASPPEAPPLAALPPPSLPPTPQQHVSLTPPAEPPLKLTFADLEPVHAASDLPKSGASSPASSLSEYTFALPGPSSAPRRSFGACTPAREADRESDSGSSLATEAYNSEDEHSSRPGEVPTPASSSAGSRGGPSTAPMLTPEQREAAFRTELARRHWEIVVVRADGNCLFRALAHSLWGEEALHAQLRVRVMDYMLKERDYFSQFVAEDFPRYVRRKRRDGCHGNHVELQAAADLLGVRIEVYAYSLTPVTVIESWNQQSDDRSEPLRLSFHRGSHYNAVVNSVRPMRRWTKKVPYRGGRASAAAAAAGDAELLAIADALATQEELEQAALEMSIADMRRPRRGSSAASSSTAVSRDAGAAEDPQNALREVNADMLLTSKRGKHPERARPGSSSALPPPPQSSLTSVLFPEVRSRARAGPSSAGASVSSRRDSSDEKDEQR